MEEAEEMNPLFANAPHIDFRLSRNPKMMVRHFQSTISNIKQLIIFESSRENDGIPQYVGHATPIHTPEYLGLVNPQYTHKAILLPKAKNKYFILVMHPPEELGNVEPLKFLFCLHNLYLQGFSLNNVWQVFQDAELEGVDEVAFSQWIRRIPLKCNYNDLKPNYFTLRTGYFGQLHTFNVVPMYGIIEIKEVKIALSRTIATVSEALRFPPLSRHIMFGFNSTSDYELKNEAIDNVGKLQSKQKKTHFWDHVRDWKTYCTWILYGEEEFTPAPAQGFPSFESVVALTGVVLYVDRDKVQAINSERGVSSQGLVVLESDIQVLARFDQAYYKRWQIVTLSSEGKCSDIYWNGSLKVYKSCTNQEVKGRSSDVYSNGSSKVNSSLSYQEVREEF